MEETSVSDSLDDCLAESKRALGYNNAYVFAVRAFSRAYLNNIVIHENGIILRLYYAFFCIGVKLGLSHRGRIIGGECSRIGCCRIFNLLHTTECNVIL